MYIYIIYLYILYILSIDESDIVLSKNVYLEDDDQSQQIEDLGRF